MATRRSRARQLAQPHKRCNAIGDHGDAIRLGPARQRGERETFLRRQRILEGDGAGEQAAVKLGQHDMHREIGGAEPARTILPGGAFGGGADHLQDWNAGGVERRRLIGAAAGRKGRHGDDQCRIEPRHASRKKRVGFAIFQAGDEKRRRREAAAPQAPRTACRSARYRPRAAWRDRTRWESQTGPGASAAAKPIERRRRPRPADNRPRAAPLSARAMRRRVRHGAPDGPAARAYLSRPPSRK